MDVPETKSALRSQAETIPSLFWQTVFERAGKTAAQVGRDERWEKVSWEEFGNRVRRVAHGFLQAGVKPGDHVGICLPTSFDWEVIDFALASLGCVVVAIYERSTPRKVCELLQLSDTPYLVVENAERLNEILAENPSILRKGFGVRGGDQTSVQKFLEGPPLDDSDLFSLVKAVDPKHAHTIVFTSGTTATPKAVVLSHKNFVSVLKGLKIPLFGFQPKMLPHLTLSHVLQRTALYRRLTLDIVTLYPEKSSFEANARTKAQPHVLVTVPRILERLKQDFDTEMSKVPRWVKKLIQWRIERNVHRLKSGEKRRRSLLLFWFRSRAWGRKLSFVVCGGATLSYDLEVFFWAVGVKLLQGYGLTESTAPAAVNSPRKYRLGTVGKPVKGVDLKIAEDGEILLAGDSVFEKYYKNPEATEKAFVEIQGKRYFRTGDLGKLDEDGFLKILGRSKDLLVLSTGEKVSPTPLEQELREKLGANEIVLLGDEKSHLGAAVFLRSEKAREEVEKVILRFNEERPPYERIRRFRMFQAEEIESKDLFTPTMKLKRTDFLQSFQKDLDDLFEKDVFRVGR